MLREPFASAQVRRIGVLSNASNPQKRARALALDGMLNCHADVVHLLTDHEHDIDGALAELAAAGVELLVINGGDGTVAHVLTALINSRVFDPLPTLALLPGGSSNIAVGDVGFRGSRHRAALDLCRWINGRLPTCVVTRPALQVRVPELPGPLYGLVFGAGAVVDGIDYWHDSVKARGMRGPQSSFVAMVGTLRGILGRDQTFARPVALRYGFENEPADRSLDALIVVASSMERLFLGVHPFWHTEGEGLYTTLIRSRPDRFLARLPGIVRGRDHPELHPDRGYQSRRTHRLLLSMQGRFTLDGDIYSTDARTQPLELSTGPELRFVCPERYHR